ncbi:MAG: hypothetical protein JWQ11_1764, partial [Rhizobacter sp.]|nr:hypothetical protein [Rhizobacter sp.]
MVAIPRSLTSSLFGRGFWRKEVHGSRSADVASQDIASPATDAADAHHGAVLPTVVLASAESFELPGSNAPTAPTDSIAPPAMLAASGILASEYYAGQARAAEVTGSEEWIRTPSCNIARDEMAAQGVCDGPDDPLGAVAAPSGSYAPLLTGLLAAVAVGAAAGGGGGSSGTRTTAASDIGGNDSTSHPGVLASVHAASD